VTDAAAALSALRDGLALAVQYNPLYAAVTAALAAALGGYPGVRRERWRWAPLVLAVGWLVGDGFRVLGRARDFSDGSAAFRAEGTALWPGWTTIAVWALGSLVIGYVLPAVIGAAVGRRVTHGTGWLAAAAIASALTLSVSAAIGALG
jgi:hypothetical protein